MSSYFLFLKVAYSKVQTHSHLKMIYIKNYYTWAAVEYYLLHYVLKQYAIQKRRKKDQISNKELDYLEIYKWDNMIKNNIFL